jgi:DNA-binding NarL/FixJ family response regulator
MTARQARKRAAAVGAESLCANLMSAEDAEPAAQHRPDADRDVAVLSDAEWRVACLAALGHTNTEISRKLFITVSTVEQHLTRVYRKLKVASRGDLPTVLRSTDAVDVA